MLISGKKVSEAIFDSLKKEVEILKTKNIVPSLVIVRVGDDPASVTYVGNKLKLCERLGVNGKLIRLEPAATQEELVSLINELNKDNQVNGILVQLPLPKHIDETIICQTISPDKDVDCFNEVNVGKLWSAKKIENNLILPCTPAGIIQLLKYYNLNISGEDVVIVGRSNIVGKPLAALFLNENATVTICHSRTKDLANKCAQAKILVAAIGKPKFITKEFTNPNQIIIDVGINRDENGKLCGDVDYENVSEYVSAISPVPGGVGPMTIIMLSSNLITATKKQHHEN